MGRRQDAGTRAATALGAVDEADLSHCFANPVVGVPAAATEPARREPALVKPRRLVANPLRRVTGRRTRMRGARPVRVQAKVPGGARALEPSLLVFAESRIGRTDQRDDVEAARARLPQLIETMPCRIVERPLEVAGDDSRARHTAAEST